MKTVAAVAVLFYLGSPVVADIIRQRNSRNFINTHLVGCGDLDAPMPRERHERQPPNLPVHRETGSGTNFIELYPQKSYRGDRIYLPPRFYIYFMPSLEAVSRG